MTNKQMMEQILAQQTEFLAQMTELTERVVALEKSKEAPKTTTEKSSAPTTEKSDNKTVVFMKYNKETGKRDIAVPCTPAQKAAWEKASARYKSAEERDAQKDANLAKWEQDREKFQSKKPPKKLVDFIKANPHCTRKEAKEYGFVGTRDDLKALKESLK